MRRKLFALLAVLVAAVVSAAAAPPAVAATGPSIVVYGYASCIAAQTSVPPYHHNGDCDWYFGEPSPFTMWSSNGLDRLMMYPDGSLKGASTDYTVWWDSHTANRGAYRLSLQDDCNMVIYTSSNAVLWASGTETGQTEQWCRVTMGGDQHFSIWSGGTGSSPVWYRTGSSGYQFLANHGNAGRAG